MSKMDLFYISITLFGFSVMLTFANLIDIHLVGIANSFANLGLVLTFFGLYTWNLWRYLSTN